MTTSVSAESRRLLRGLNPSQVKAVTTTDGPVLVVAGPGSGKTRVLTHRIAHLLEECDVLPDQILAVTFTNKASREMRNRIDQLMRPGATDGLWMGTFHSFGVRVLRQNPGLVADTLGLQSNFLIYDDADQQNIAKRAIVAANLDPRQLPPRRVTSYISKQKSLLRSPAEARAAAIHYGEEVDSRVYAEYQRLLQEANAVDFDDLLRLPIELFERAPSALERYQLRFRYILVDEYQDTNRVQYVLVTALSNHWRNIFVVGDPDQSIYAWRHADIRNILDFQEDYPDAVRIDLEVNYRSTQRIVAAADAVIKENVERLDRKLRTDNDEGDAIVLRELADQNHEAQFVVAEIRRLMQSRGIRPEEIAIMYRTTAQSRVLEESFRTSGVPYRVVGGVRFYERKEIKDLLAVLRILHNPADMVSLERIIGNFAIGKGIGPKAVDTIRNWAAMARRPMTDGFVAIANQEENAPTLSGAAKSAASRVGTVLRRLHASAASLPPSELLDEIVELTNYRDAFDINVEEELQRWANVQELRNDLARYDIVSDPTEAVATFLEQVSLVADVDSLTDDDQGQVTLITLHSAKGLEFPVVFLVGIEEGLLPINRACEAEANGDTRQVEEERRLFYVGITRAESLLYFSYTGNRLSYRGYQSSAPSRFLDAIPPHLLHTLTRNFGRSPLGVQTSGGLRDRVRSYASDTNDGRSTFGGEQHDTMPVSTVAPLLPGQRVFHTKFGEGQVLDVLPRVGDQEVVVNFARHGAKRLMASLAGLEVIESESPSPTDSP